MKEYEVCITGRQNSIWGCIKNQIVFWETVEANNKAEAKEKAWEEFHRQGKFLEPVYEKKNEFMRKYNAKYKKEKAKENPTQSEVKPKRNRIKEKTTANSCPKDCEYQGCVGSIPCCDYILITGEPRGCEVGKGCTRYKREQGKRKKSQDMPKITHRPDDDAEFCGFKQENMNRIVGNNHRKGTR